MKKIALLTGGTGLEREVAIKSADFFQNHLSTQFDIYFLPEQLELFLSNYKSYFLAIPIFHGEYGEDGKIFAFLNILGIPHTFSDYKTHTLGLDKEKTNILVSQLGVNVPFQYVAKNNLDFPEKYPIIMKPNNGGSSFHTYKIENNEDFSLKYDATKSDLEDEILVQEFIAGDEYSVPMVQKEVLPIMKLEKNVNDIFDYESKYKNESKIKETFPEISIELKNNLENTSLRIYEYFKIQGMCRIDFLVRNSQIYFLEINTIPGMTQSSILPKAWSLTGRTPEKLIEKIITIN